MRVVAHRPTHRSVSLWVQAETDEVGWRLVVTGDGSDRSWDPDDHRPRLLPNVTRRAADTRIWFAELDGLEPGTDYVVRVAPPDDDRASTPIATFRTVRSGLPSAAGDPFTVLLASCYSEDRDTDLPAITHRSPGRVRKLVQAATHAVRRAFVTRQSLRRKGPPPPEPTGNVSRRYRDVCAATKEPDLKILVGDQVYIDSPIQRFWLPMSDAGARRHISRAYSRTWDKLGWFLAHGGNVFTTDDHEFWNNYPSTPWAWPRLLPAGFRRAWERHAREFLDHVQAPQPTWSIDVGEPAELSFFVADTRMHRQQPDAGGEGSGRFMRPDHLRALLDWIDGLRSPGVLALGQPLFSDTGSGATDFTLPDYRRQYAELSRHLAAAAHDVLVLSGDIHYGRHARVEVPREDTARPLVVQELVASPLAILFGAAGSFSPPPDLHFPPDSAHHVDFRPTICADPGADHFLTLAFTRSDGDPSVRVDVVAHLMRSDETTVPLGGGPIILR